VALLAGAQSLRRRRRDAPRARRRAQGRSRDHLRARPTSTSAPPSGASSTCWSREGRLGAHDAIRKSASTRSRRRFRSCRHSARPSS
jgi:hypothetical protein